MFKYKRQHIISSNSLILIVLVFLFSAGSIGRAAYSYNNQAQTQEGDNWITISAPKEAESVTPENTEALTNNKIVSSNVPKESSASQSSKSQTSTYVDVIEPSDTSAHDLVFKQRCDGKKTRMLEALNATHSRDVTSENSLHQQNLSALAAEYNSRGMLDSGEYFESVEAENTAHQQRLDKIDSWRKNELLKIDSTC